MLVYPWPRTCRVPALAHMADGGAGGAGTGAGGAGLFVVCGRARRLSVLGNLIYHILHVMKYNPYTPTSSVEVTRSRIELRSRRSALKRPQVTSSAWTCSPWPCFPCAIGHVPTHAFSRSLNSYTRRDWMAASRVASLRLLVCVPVSLHQLPPSDGQL